MEAFWRRVEAEDEVRYLAVPDWQQRILDERLKDLGLNPDDEQLWEVVKAELRP